MKDLSFFVEQDAERLLAMLTKIHGEKTWDMPDRIRDLIEALKRYLDSEQSNVCA